MVQTAHEEPSTLLYIRAKGKSSVLASFRAISVLHGENVHHLVETSG
jgi:hypothetical protein